MQIGTQRLQLVVSLIIICFDDVGILNALTRTSAETSPRKYQKSSNRKQVFTEYHFRGVAVCQSFFQFVYAVGPKELRNVRSTFLEKGVEEVLHGNVRNVPRNKTLSLEAWKYAVHFIRRYGIQNGLVLPGRVPEFRNYKDLCVLPSITTKLSVFELYEKACTAADITAVGRSTWFVVWDQLCSHVVIQKPKTDLCVTCKTSIISMNKLHNLPEEEKQRRIQVSLDHLNLVQVERDYYKKVREDCEKALPLKYRNVVHIYRTPNSYRGTMHYSFDYAQQIFIPHDSQQVGPVYFLAPYKVGLFGIVIEPLNHFVLYVIPESAAIGKGSNSVISFLHHCLENFSCGESEVHLHADNCCGQNKNRFMLNYSSWRVVRGYNENVKLSFLPVGHTKFKPDSRFGNFKGRWRRAQANCLKHVCEIAAKAKNTTVVLVGDENGNLLIDQYDWSTYFKQKRFATVDNIRKYHHFEINLYNVSVMYHQDYLHSPIERTEIIPDNSSVDGHPDIILPEGLSKDRRKYLFKKIRFHVSEKCKDILCPTPE